MAFSANFQRFLLSRGEKAGDLNPRSRLLRLLILCLLLLFQSHQAFGYSVLTHEAIIDAEWEDHIKPLFVARFPRATAQQLHEAQAYAYGGSVIQDMGYYPFGSRFFSHLTHYVRSGYFVQALFNESRDINDYAFALGALSHYVADIEGHSIAVNRSVGLLYPALHKKYGDSVTWEESPWEHSLTEFGFDTLEVVAHHVAPEGYHQWIGFKVARPLLQRAFKKTYGLNLSDQILSVRIALFSYRELASSAIPEMAEVTWALRRKQLEELASNFQHRQLYHLSRKSYRGWQSKYAKPGVGDEMEAFLFRIIPKVGPFNVIQFHSPTLETEKLFADSLRATVQRYELELRQIESGKLDPPDMDLDTGSPTRPGEYRYCDRTYAQLLRKLESKRFMGVDAALRSNLLEFYKHAGDNAVSKNRRQWRRVLRTIEELKSASAPPSSSPANSTVQDPSAAVFVLHRNLLRSCP